MHIFVGAFWTLVGLVMLITGSASINEGWIVLSERHARIFGAATMVLGVLVMSGNVLLDALRTVAERFVTREVILGAFFIATTALFVIMASVMLIRWARAGGGR